MTNPYAPPSEISPQHSGTRQAVFSRVSRPATALIIMASIQSAMIAIVLVSSLVVYAREGSVPGGVVALSLYGAQMLGLIVIAIGAAKLGFLESRKLAMLGACLACIPFITPFVFVGIPFGVWALRLLRDPTVAAAFPDSTPRAKPIG